MKKIIISLVIALMSFISLWAKNIEGYKIADTLNAAGTKLILNGAGIREKFFIAKDIYVSGLYLKQKSSNPTKIIAANEPMAIRIKIVSTLVTPERFMKATYTGFKESMGKNSASLKKEINMFINVFKSGIKDGDIFDIVYSGGSIKVFKNKSKTPKVKIQGMKIKKAIFGIWLKYRSDKYLRVLKNKMLGK